MAKARSPRYPAIGLPEAIHKVQAVYENDFTNEVPKEVVAAHMGYSGLNGASLGVISAVSKYGLLAGGRDGMRVTQRALDILANEPGSLDRIAAIEAAAKEPDLFEEIFTQFPRGASDQALKSFLITRKKFLPSACTAVIRAFRETARLLDEESGGSERVQEEATEYVERDAESAGIQSRRSEAVVEQKAPSHPSAKDNRSNGPEISFSGDIIRLSGNIRNQPDAQKVIDFLTATKHFLPDPGPMNTEQHPKKEETLLLQNRDDLEDL